MKRLFAVFAAAFIAVGMMGLTALSAQATNVANWSTNGESEILSSTSVMLKGENTSIETGNLNVNVNQGDTVSFEYELREGAECVAGSPRVFTFVNGVNNKSDACDGAGSTSDSDEISYEVDRAGLITHTGLVYDNGRGGHIIIKNLKIDDELVYFAKPQPEPTTVTPEPPTVTPATCEDAAVLNVPEIDGVVYSHESGPIDAGDVTVTAEAAEGYVFPDGFKAEWTLSVAEAPTDCDEPGGDDGNEAGDDDGNEAGDDDGTEDGDDGTEDGDDAGSDDDATEDGDDAGTDDGAGDDKGAGGDDGSKDDDDAKDDDDDAGALPDTGTGVGMGLGIGVLALLAGGAALMIRQRRNAAVSLNG